MVAIVSEATQVREQRELTLVNFHARSTAGQTVSGVASVVRSALKSLRRR